MAATPHAASGLPASPPYDINPLLTPEQQTLLSTVLTELPAAFAGNAPPMASPDVQHSIHLNNPVPVKQNAYRQSPEKQQVIRRTVEDLLKRGLVRESNSPWSSPVILVPKHDGGWRMCIDYRKLNAQTVKDAYPVPLIDDCLTMCREAKWFTLIDIKDAYHHIPMDPVSIPLTAFVTPDGLFEWLRMPFGLAVAPATFQRYVDKGLRGLLGRICTAFFDDCLVFSSGSFEDHVGDVRTVLKRLGEHRLEANLKKCKFGYTEILFVGHVVGRGTIRPDPAKLSAVSQFPTPTGLTTLRSFLGLANYYHRFIRNYSILALPLYQLTRKNTPWEWSGRAEAAFVQLKTALLSAPCLHAPDSTRPYTLQTDASLEGIAAVLSQLDSDQAEHPVCFVSRQLNSAERNYSATELECLAVVWSVGQLEIYLVDKPFTLETDHSALLWMPTKKFENTRVMRWALKLQEFSYTVRHRAGKANGNADALSRCPAPGTAPPEPSHPLSTEVGLTGKSPHFVRTVHAQRADCPFPTHAQARVPLRLLQSRDYGDGVLSRLVASAKTEGGENTSADLSLIDTQEIARLVKAQHAHPPMRQLIDHLLSGATPATFDPIEKLRFLQSAKNYVLMPQTSGAEALYYALHQPRRGLSSMVPFEPRLVVPPEFQLPLLRLFHDTPFAGHFGVKRTYRKISARYYWPTLLVDVTRFVGNCQICQRHKAQRRGPPTPVGMIDPPQSPFELLSMDFIGPLKPRSEDFEHVLVIIDHFTRWAIAIPTQNQNAETVASALVDEVFHKYGVPLRLLSDRGSAFRSQLLIELQRLLRVKPLFTSAHHPQCNGMVERLNGTLKTILSNISQDFKSQWVQVLQAAVFAYNTSVSEATGYTPYFLLYGREALTPGDSLASSAALSDVDAADPVSAWVADLLENLRDAHSLVRTLLSSKLAFTQQQRDQLAQFPTYAVGDKVWLRDSRTDVRTGGNRTSAHPWMGPYTVIQKLSDVNYILRRGPKGVHTTAHLSRMKPFRESLDSEPATADNFPAIAPAAPPRAATSTPLHAAPPSIPSRAPRSRERQGVGGVLGPSEDEECKEALEVADAYAQEGYRAPSPLPAQQSQADTPAASVTQRRRALPRVNLNENVLFPTPAHSAAQRHSLPRRPEGS